MESRKEAGFLFGKTAMYLEGSGRQAKYMVGESLSISLTLFQMSTRTWTTVQ